MIANRCLASGTNGWTGMDQTCYNMTTAGSEGFLNLLPIFLDHILNPTLNDSFFVTEIYHVNGEGQDGGVVFSEMRSYLSPPGRVITYEALKLLFPGECGYKWVTGGSIANLRNSTNNHKIQKYHRKFYRPENMVIIVSGGVDKEKLFESIRPVEEEEEGKEREPFVKPFSEPCPPLERKVTKKVIEYPDEEEKFGMVTINWRLSDLSEDKYQYLAHDIMMNYLGRGVSSPLQKAFVETASPLATDTSISFASGKWQAARGIWGTVHFANVPIDRLDEVKPAYFSLMRNVSITDIDMDRLRGILRTTLTKRSSILDVSPGVLFLSDAIQSFIYEDNMEDFHSVSRDKLRYENMLKEDESFWRETMKSFAKEDELVFIVGKPSKRVMKEREEKDEAFIDERIRRLGKEGLAEKARILQEAKDTNDAHQIPDHVLATIPIPSTDSILLPEVITVRSRRLHPDAESQRPPKNAAEITNLINVLDSPYAIQISHYESPDTNFEAYAHASQLEDKLKPYLGLYVSLVFGTDVKRDEKTASHEEINLELDRETVGYGASFSHRTGIITYFVSVGEKKFRKGLQYLKEGLTRQVFTKKRIQHFITTYNNSFPAMMKSPLMVMDEVMTPMLVKNDSFERIGSFVALYRMLDTLADDVRDNEGRGTMEKFRRITEHITDPERVIFYIGGNLKSAAEMLKREDRRNLESVLDEYLGGFRRSGEPASSSSVCLAYTPYAEFRLPVKKGTSEVKVLSMGTEETASLNMVSASDAPVDYADLPVLKVISNYFNMMEGPLWKQIRGLGLAYGFYFQYSTSKGYANFGAKRVTDVIQVYEEAKKFVDGLTEDEDALNTLTLESAKSSLVFSFIAGSDKPAYIADETMSNCFLGRPLNYTKDMMERTWRVTKADVKRVVRERFQPLFDINGNTKIVIAANPAKVDKIAEDLRQMGLDVETIDVEKMNAEDR